MWEWQYLFIFFICFWFDYLRRVIGVFCVLLNPRISADRLVPLQLYTYNFSFQDVELIEISVGNNGNDKIVIFV
jgi:hypothetical protein